MSVPQRLPVNMRSDVLVHTVMCASCVFVCPRGLFLYRRHNPQQLSAPCLGCCMCPCKLVWCEVCNSDTHTCLSGEGRTGNWRATQLPLAHTAASNTDNCSLIFPRGPCLDGRRTTHVAAPPAAVLLSRSGSSWQQSCAGVEQVW